MRIEDALKTLPNGLHNALLHTINLDYVKREAVIDLELRMDGPRNNGEEPGKQYRAGRLLLAEMTYCVLEPPDMSLPYNAAKPLRIDGGRKEELKEDVLSRLPQEMRDAQSVYWFFVEDWNAFIFIAAVEGDLAWVDGPGQHR